MLSSRVEKLSLLSEIIAFAKAEKDLKILEYDFLLSISKKLEIIKEDFNFIIGHPINCVHLKSHSERIVQFYRLVLLMNVGQVRTEKELTQLYNYGLRMGLYHESISKVLYLMDGFPGMLVPAEVLIDIFKVQYN
ncbi:MAG: TerB family tellurite resistance protein [Lacinutrix sp.]|uniref:TerB family tellurite resistance protein n=1 Tax=Lacinutrix sp. TaxID=1937692 RepID=UPI0030AD7C61